MLTFTEYTDTPVTKFFYYVEKLQKHIDRALVLNLFTVCQRHGLTVPNDLMNKPVILVTGIDEEGDPILTIDNAFSVMNIWFFFLINHLKIIPYRIQFLLILYMVY